MRPRSRSVRRLLLLALLASTFLIGCGSTETPSSAPARTGAQSVEVARPGDPFPAGTFNVLNPVAGGPARVDLAASMGERPVLLYYWIAGNLRSEQVFGQLQELAGELEGKLTLYGVAMPRPGNDAELIRKRIRELDIRVPVLEDEDFELGKRLRVRNVPNITLLDREGRLQLTNGASLPQMLEHGVVLEDAIRRIASTGTLRTYGKLGRYFPVKELEGKHCPDFTAPLLANSLEKRWHSLLDDEKLNVLVFWSVDCPHCRQSLPEINEWLRQNPEEINLFTAASVPNEAVRVKTREFCEFNNFLFPTLVDEGAQIGSLYQITTTPTILIIGPDGIIDSALVSDVDFPAEIEDRKRRLLEKVDSS